MHNHIDKWQLPRYKKNYNRNSEIKNHVQLLKSLHNNFKFCSNRNEPTSLTCELIFQIL